MTQLLVTTSLYIRKNQGGGNEAVDQAPLIVQYFTPIMLMGYVMSDKLINRLRLHTHIMRILMRLD